MSGPDVPTRPFRFGVQANHAADASGWRDLARRSEDLGYSVLTMPDHFTEQFAPIPALMAAADATTTLRVGALVWDNDYRHPTVLAKELATVDLLSHGRVEIGLGAGWMTSDYDQTGIPLDSPGVRIDRMVEGLSIIRQAFASGPFDHHGEHYRVTGYEGWPKPVQQPAPPVLIGGGGPRMVRVAARHADIVGINPTMTAGVVGPEAIASMTAEAVDSKVEMAREAAGDRLTTIEWNLRAFLVNVTDDADSAIAGLSSAMGVTEEMVRCSPFALIGPPAKLVEDLLDRRERWGFSYVIVGAEDVDSFAPVVAELAGR
jgi:probable F420-dependent oxidoreductase